MCDTSLIFFLYQKSTLEKYYEQRSLVRFLRLKNWCPDLWKYGDYDPLWLSSALMIHSFPLWDFPGPEETESPGSHAPASLWPVGEPGLGTLVKQMKSSMKFKEAFTLKCELSMRSHCLPHSWDKGGIHSPLPPCLGCFWLCQGKKIRRGSSRAPVQPGLTCPSSPRDRNDFPVLLVPELPNFHPWFSYQHSHLYK